MHYRFLFLIFASFLLSQNVFAAGISETTNGIYMVIAAVRNVTLITNEPIRFDDQLVWMNFCDTGKVMLSYPDCKYGLKIKMTDSEGNEVPKTALGERCGSKFDSLRLITDSKVERLLRRVHTKLILMERRLFFENLMSFLKWINRAFTRWRFKCRCFYMCLLMTLWSAPKVCLGFLR